MEEGIQTEKKRGKEMEDASDFQCIDLDSPTIIPSRCSHHPLIQCTNDRTLMLLAACATTSPRNRLESRDSALPILPHAPRNRISETREHKTLYMNINRRPNQLPRGNPYFRGTLHQCLMRKIGMDGPVYKWSHQPKHCAR